jgi:hypothetical protein
LIALVPFAELLALGLSVSKTPSGTPLTSVPSPFTDGVPSLAWKNGWPDGFRATG